jgi:hypothetical protein
MPWRRMGIEAPRILNLSTRCRRMVASPAGRFISVGKSRRNMMYVEVGKEKVLWPWRMDSWPEQTRNLDLHMLDCQKPRGLRPWSGCVDLADSNMYPWYECYAGGNPVWGFRVPLCRSERGNWYGPIRECEWWVGISQFDVVLAGILVAFRSKTRIRNGSSTCMNGFYSRLWWIALGLCWIFRDITALLQTNFVKWVTLEKLTVVELVK